jgi:hypothetical protein
MVDYTTNQSPKKINLPFDIKYLKICCNNKSIIDYLLDGIE